MSRPTHLNPYAPSQVCGGHPREPPDSERRARTTKVILTTFAGVMISGGVFGVVAAALVSVLDSEVAGIVELLAFVPIGMLVGAMVAGAFSLPVIFVAFCVSLVTISISQGWRHNQIRWFAGVCGFFSGLLSFAIVLGLGPAAIVIGIVPAIFGCFGTMLVSDWILRPRLTERSSAEESVAIPVPMPAPLPTNHNNT